MTPISSNGNTNNSVTVVRIVIVTQVSFCDVASQSVKDNRVKRQNTVSSSDHAYSRSTRKEKERRGVSG